jgi:excisionase family DNA binding protein
VALLLDIPTTAEALGGVSHTTVRRLIAAGELPVVRVGRRIMVEEKALTDWIQQQKRPNVAADSVALVGVESDAHGEG